MKSGIVMEVYKRKAVLMTKEGRFITVSIPKGKTLQVGSEYQVSIFYTPRRYRFFLSSLTLISLIAVLLFTDYIPIGRTEPVAAYISFDVNPSMEVGITNDLKVIEAKPYNKEAARIIRAIPLNESFSLYTDQLMEAYHKNGYLNVRQDVYVVTAKKDMSLTNSNRLDAKVENVMKSASKRQHVRVILQKVSYAARNKAQKLGLSSGKYLFFEQIHHKDQLFSAEKAQRMSINELRKQTGTAPEKIHFLSNPPREIQTSKVIRNPNPGKSSGKVHVFESRTHFKNQEFPNLRKQNQIRIFHFEKNQMRAEMHGNKNGKREKQSKRDRHVHFHNENDSRSHTINSHNTSKLDSNNQGENNNG